MTAGSTVRLGVLGCGAIARRFLPRLVANPAIRVVAVASRDSGRARDLAATVDPAPAAVEGYGALLARSDLDAVYICLPTGLHADWSLRALDSGRHVLVEKPMAAEYAAAKALTARAAATGLQLWENRMFAHHGQHDRVRRLVAKGAIGELRVVHSAMAIPPPDSGDFRYSPELGGGALLDVGFYAVHGALPFLREHTDVVGSTLSYGPAPGGVDIGGAALLTDDAGVVAQLTFGFQHSYRSYYELWGSEGRLVVERAFTPPPDFVPRVTLDRGGRTELLDLPPQDQFGAFVTAFATAVRGGLGHQRETETALRGARLLEAIRARAARPAGLGFPQPSPTPLEVS
ncbi:Gfo/Idh/MocA family protein [Amycolatopsis taiwanensis]|uniref:Oxidoreductase n=1 Tax=Amycolatopsis taiwanensis TaxID=342230 RepID=A0A9W6R5Z7_9PSEU|nr:Gfo/Idh/MocA family oxidoreductase [Amycolatopsis taiwanensis]GLY68970.1 oxidoreductase [Amycolatopsis taiwanensis]